MSVWCGVPIKYDSYRTNEGVGKPIILSVGSVAFSPEAVIPLHAHGSYQLILIESGVCNYSFDTSSVYLKRGGFCYARPGEFHEIRGLGGERWSFHYIEVENFTPYKTDGLFWRAGIRILHDCEDLIPVFEDVKKETKEISNGSCAVTGELFMELAKRMQMLDIYSGIRAYSEDLISSRDYIDKNVVHGMSTREVADFIGLRDTRIRRRFADEMNISIGRYIKLALMRKAEKMLRAGEHVSKASEKLGFPSVQYFSASFKRCAGVCPTRFQSDSKHKYMCPISW